MEDLAFLNDFLVVVVFGICLLVGYLIKTSIKRIPNDFIPVIVAILGVLINVWVNNFAFTPVILLQGLFSGLASTGAYEAITHVFKNKFKSVDEVGD